MTDPVQPGAGGVLAVVCGRQIYEPGDGAHQRSQCCRGVQATRRVGCGTAPQSVSPAAAARRPPTATSSRSGSAGLVG
jgi:hypothetical protein